MDAGDGSAHCRRFAVVDLGLTGVKTVGIGRFWRKSRKSAIWGFRACDDRGQPVSAARPARTHFFFLWAGSSRAARLDGDGINADNRKCTEVKQARSLKNTWDGRFSHGKETAE
ncbi:hypothetical protein CRG98_011080 [Punica granatum]|uniref:Uncharacterized protein n=1 Tax=Punica granatum TaxID=22663 RepID=A0A2I0KJ70_PUNGR|nr:hypothetical protein CRG98_011080 [Punica granatum]